MAKKLSKPNKGRVLSSNITVVVSIALVLFLLGLFGLIVINAQSYADYIKEQLKVEAFFHPNTDPAKLKQEEKQHLAFIDSIKQQDFVRSVSYITEEQASVLAKKSLGIDDHELFEENIFPASAQISIKSNFVEPARLDSLVKVISKNPIVEEAKNDQELVFDVYQSIDRITFWLIALAALFLLIVIVLINNSIRLKIYAKRFGIKTMQLVGARRRFIMKPFIIQGVVLGLLGAILALLALGAVWYLFTARIDYPFWNFEYTYLIAGILLIGVCIAFFSTVIATWRYLKLRTNQLY